MLRVLSLLLKYQDHTLSVNDNILLSPASPSFDMFENYEERGAAFISAVQNFVK